MKVPIWTSEGVWAYTQLGEVTPKRKRLKPKNTFRMLRSIERCPEERHSAPFSDERQWAEMPISIYVSHALISPLLACPERQGRAAQSAWQAVRRSLPGKWPSNAFPGRGDISEGPPGMKGKIRLEPLRRADTRPWHQHVRLPLTMATSETPPGPPEAAWARAKPSLHFFMQMIPTRTYLRVRHKAYFQPGGPRGGRPAPLPGPVGKALHKVAIARIIAHGGTLSPPAFGRQTPGAHRYALRRHEPVLDMAWEEE